MPTAPTVKNPATILGGFKTSFSRLLGVNDYTSDSKLRAITEPLAKEIIDLNEAQLNLFNARNPSTARGLDLDALALEAGISRNPASFAFVTASSRCLAFYVTSGSFGSLFEGATYTIPANTRIHSTPNGNDKNSTVSFYTTEDVVLEAAETVVFVSARAQYATKEHNVDAYVLNSHNVPLNTLRVINFFPILNGTDRETDEQLRFRLSRVGSANTSRNADRGLLAGLSVPGVLLVKTLPGYYGPGTNAVIVLGTDMEVSPNLLRSVQDRLDRDRVAGVRSLAVGAVKNLLVPEMVLEVKQGITAAEKTALQARLISSLKDLCRAQGLGGAVSLNSLEEVIRVTAGSYLTSPTSTKKRIVNLRSQRDTENTRYFRNKLVYQGTIQLEEDEYADVENISVRYVEG